MRRTTDTDFNAHRALANAVRVRAATTVDVTIASALNAGETLDGVTLSDGDLVLVKDQSSAAENGVYIVATVPARHPDFVGYDAHASLLVTVAEGSTNAGSVWLCTSNQGGTIGTTALAFSLLVPAAGAQPLDSDLTAIAALTTTTYGRSLLTLANAAAADWVEKVGDTMTGQLEIAFSAAGTLVEVVNTIGDDTSRDMVHLRHANDGLDLYLRYSAADWALHSESDAGGVNWLRLDGAGATVEAGVELQALSAAFVQSGLATTSISLETADVAFFQNTSWPPMIGRRNGSDGTLLAIYNDSSQIGQIAFSGGTVSYNTFTGAHWSQLADFERREILPGTVMETIDELCRWYAVQYAWDGKPMIDEAAWRRLEGRVTGGEVLCDVVVSRGRPVPWAVPGERVAPDDKVFVHGSVVLLENDRLPRCKVSDTAGSRAVYGVFQRWDDGDGPNPTNDVLVNALGSGVIRMQKGQLPALGDFLESAGDGTARVQRDAVLRSSTIAKVTGTTRVVVYDDGSFLVPCTLHCG